MYKATPVPNMIENASSMKGKGLRALCYSGANKSATGVSSSGHKVFTCGHQLRNEY